MTEYSPCLLSISEHWLRNMEITNYKIPNYKLVTSFSRSIHKGGGCHIR